MVEKEDVSYYKYAQVGLELAAGVGLGFWAGYRLDLRFGTAPWLMLARPRGMAAGFYLVVRELPGKKILKAGRNSPGISHDRLRLVGRGLYAAS